MMMAAGCFGFKFCHYLARTGGCLCSGPIWAAASGGVIPQVLPLITSAIIVTLNLIHQ